MGSPPFIQQRPGSRAKRENAYTVVLGAALIAAIHAVACSSNGARPQESQTRRDPAAYATRPTARLLIGRIVDAVAHPQGPNGRRGIHTELTVTIQSTSSRLPDREARIWVPGGRLGRRARVLSDQPQLAVGESGLFVSSTSSEVSAVAARIRSDGSAADPTLELATGEQLPLSALTKRLQASGVYDFSLLGRELKP